MNQGNSKEAVEARKKAWLDRLQFELERMVACLKRHPNVRRVILFGSLARCEARNHSDIDIVIIQDTGKSFLARLDEFYGAIHPTVETDILVYTPREWDELRQSRDFVKRLEGEGVVLYDCA